MCGIVGIVSSFRSGLSYSEGEMFETMLFLDTLRGWDSTGVFGIDSLGNVGIHKGVLHGADFICTPEFKDFKDKAGKSGVCVVGHNRAATKGTIIDENAHPFYVDDKIILVQNGTFRGNHKKFKDVDVDSHALAHLLCEEPDITKALKQVDAAYALVWYNTETETLHLIRNKERPLWIAEFEHGGFMFASERETIMYSAFKSPTSPKFKGDPYMLDVHVLMSVTFNGRVEIEKKLLKCEFDHPFVPVMATGYELGPNWRHAYSEYEGAESEGGFTRTGTSITSGPRRHNPNDLNEIFFTIYKIVEKLIDGEEEFYFKNSDAAFAEKSFVEANLDRERYGMIEIHDYYPANDLHGCEAFHIISKVWEDTERSGPFALVHHMKYNVRDIGDLQRMLGNIYTARLNTPNVISFLNDLSLRTYALTVTATNLEDITVTSTTH